VIEATPRISPLALAIAFVQVGLTSVGGAAAPLRHVLVVRRKWLTETEFSETFGIAQALPGATAANLSVILGDRYGGALGSISALAGLCLPSLAVALVLATFATQLSETNRNFAAAEAAVTAAVAGLFIANGLRLAYRVWIEGARGSTLGFRFGRLAISLGGIAMVALAHIPIPFAVAILAPSSFGIEWWVRYKGNLR
jgi:chromate transporter